MGTVARLGNRREGEGASVNNPGVENQDPESFTKHETPNACTPLTPCVDGEMAEGGRRAAVRGPWVVPEVALLSLGDGEARRGRCRRRRWLCWRGRSGDSGVDKTAMSRHGHLRTALNFPGRHFRPTFARPPNSLNPPCRVCLGQSRDGSGLLATLPTASLPRQKNKSSHLPLFLTGQQPAFAYQQLCRCPLKDFGLLSRAVYLGAQETCP